MDQLARTIFGDGVASEAVCKIPLHFLRFQTCENSNDHLEEMFSVATKTNELFQTNYFSLTAIPD